MNRAGGLPGLYGGAETTRPNYWNGAQGSPWHWLPLLNAASQAIFLDGNFQKQAIILSQATPVFKAVPNLIDGAMYELLIVQDGTGSRVPSWTTSGVGSIDWGSGGAPTLTTTANAADLLVFEAFRLSPVGTLRLRYCGIQKGYS